MQDHCVPQSVIEDLIEKVNSGNVKVDWDHKGDPLADLEAAREVMEEYEYVHHPKHYNSHPSGVECIDIIRHYPCDIAQVIRYLWRAGLKPGEDTLKDLEKAQFYLNDQIEMIKKEMAGGE